MNISCDKQPDSCVCVCKRPYLTLTIATILNESSKNTTHGITRCSRWMRIHVLIRFLHHNRNMIAFDHITTPTWGSLTSWNSRTSILTLPYHPHGLQQQKTTSKLTCSECTNKTAAIWWIVLGKKKCQFIRLQIFSSATVLCGMAACNSHHF